MSHVVFFLRTVLIPFREIWNHHSVSGVVTGGAAPFGLGWLGEILPHHQEPSASFEPRTSISRVRRSTDWATWRPAGST